MLVRVVERTAETLHPSARREKTAVAPAIPGPDNDTATVTSFLETIGRLANAGTARHRIALLHCGRNRRVH
jgi:hypothetical protein